MALSAASCLHYWSSRYGHIPVIGGKPVHARASTARLVDIASQQLVEVPAATPRDTQLITVDGEERAGLLLEMGSTNNMLHASDFSNAAWAKTNCTVTTGILGPDGSTGACTLTATAAPGDAFQDLAAGTDLIRTNSIWVRRRTGSGTVSLRNAIGGALVALALTDKWQRFETVAATGTARAHGIRIATSGDAVDVFLAQQEDKDFSTSEIPTTTAAASRSADSLYWDYLLAPQAVAIYCRFVERGSIKTTSARIFELGSLAGASPRWVLYMAGGFYRAHHETAGGTVTSTLAVAPAVGDTVELLMSVKATGETKLVQSINAAAVSSAAESAALAQATAFSDTKLCLNGQSGTALGANRFAELKIVKYADVAAATDQGRMAEIRNFELGPNRELLAAA